MPSLPGASLRQRLALLLSLAFAFSACASAPSKPTAQNTAPATAAKGAEPAPAFALRDQFGHTWTQSDSQSKPLLIDLWATWCAPCIQALPDLERFHRQHGAQIQMLGLAMDIQGWPVVTPVIKRMEVSYPVLIGTPALSKAYGVTSYPYLVVVQHGAIVKRLSGRQSYNDLEEALEPWLQ